jgi:hypothetical protein
MDNGPSVPVLPSLSVECSFVTLPDPFDRRKETYRKFRQQFGLFITANREKFRAQESMIWFTLSYMKGGDAELWANTYVDRAIENDSWGTWEDFLWKLAKDFGSAEELWKALEEMGKLQQGKKAASEYFLKYEQLADLARVNLNQYPNATLYIEKNVQHILIDQLYQSDTPPTTYQEYKRRIIAMDEMRRRCDVHRTPQKVFIPRVRDVNTMEVNRTTKKETRKCFACGKEGHLTRTCPDREKKQNF